VGLVTHRVPLKGFRDVLVTSLPPFPSFLAQWQSGTTRHCRTLVPLGSAKEMSNEFELRVSTNPLTLWDGSRASRRCVTPLGHTPVLHKPAARYVSARSVTKKTAFPYPQARSPLRSFKKNMTAVTKHLLVIQKNPKLVLGAPLQCLSCRRGKADGIHVFVERVSQCHYVKHPDSIFRAANLGPQTAHIALTDRETLEQVPRLR
jgi:hypothetical protein